MNIFLLYIEIADNNYNNHSFVFLRLNQTYSFMNYTMFC